MIQTLIALFIVALALCWVLVRVVKTMRGKDTGCNCGCGSKDCKACKH
ncbi:MAG: FeoB-associated Cys-rich membrane protein [Muribaculaceae bacterium]|nr:FeoB-associated Cys-rich membrane protein [Muribaculaceae bacterium]MBR3101014.1 FeoB-associated Cys-rich membrane protein [Muribaculaceae bacterium]